MERWEALERELRQRLPRLELRRDEPMSRHTSFRVGGPAALMAFPKTEEEARAVAETALRWNERPFFLGNGTNLLVADAGYDGLIVKCEKLNRLERDGDRRVIAGAGTLLSRLAGFAADRGLSGLEFASGIPGSVGGALAMNAGAYGGELSSIAFQALELDETMQPREIFLKKSDFSYRRSIFSQGDRLILEAVFLLEPGDPARIRGKMADLAARRRAKQPLDLPSAGSTFKRPAPLPDGTPVYAAELIEGSGCKGLRIGGAQVSEKHAGFLVNAGGATCADILALMEEVKRRVREDTGVELEPEVKILGV